MSMEAAQVYDGDGEDTLFDGSPEVQRRAEILKRLDEEISQKRRRIDKEDSNKPQVCNTISAPTKALDPEYVYRMHVVRLQRSIHLSFLRVSMGMLPILFIYACTLGGKSVHDPHYIPVLVIVLATFFTGLWFALQWPRRGD